MTIEELDRIAETPEDEITTDDLLTAIRGAQTVMRVQKEMIKFAVETYPCLENDFKRISEQYR